MLSTPGLREVDDGGDDARRASARSRYTGIAYAYTSRMSSPTARHGARAGSSDAEVELGRHAARRGCRRATPESSRNGGISTSSAGKRDERVDPLLDRDARDDVDGRRRATSTGTDSCTMRRSIGQARPQRRDERDDRRRARTAPRAPAVTPCDADQVGREEQARQRDHVAGGGDDRRGDVVEVPDATHAERRDADGDHEHDDRGQHRRPRPRRRRSRRPRSCRSTPEADRDRLGEDREDATTPTTTARPTPRGSGRRRCRRAARAGTCRRGSTVPSRLPSAPKTLPRMPIAAGTRTRRPGSRSSVPVIEPRVRPARRSPAEEHRSATKPARTPAGSARTSARNRRTRRGGRSTVSDSEARSSRSPSGREGDYPLGGSGPARSIESARSTASARAGCDLDVVEVPRVDPDDGCAGAQRERDLRERAVRATDGDDRVDGPDDERVAHLAETRRDRDVDVRVRLGRDSTRGGCRRPCRRRATRRGPLPPSRRRGRHRRRTAPRAASSRPTSSACAVSIGGRDVRSDNRDVRSKSSVAAHRNRGLRTRRDALNHRGAVDGARLVRNDLERLHGPRRATHPARAGTPAATVARIAHDRARTSRRRARHPARSRRRGREAAYGTGSA